MGAGSLSVNEGMAGLSDGIGYRDWLAGPAGTKGCGPAARERACRFRGKLDAKARQREDQ